ncbi:MAG: cell division protein SepF [Selenomonadaceae bacterium]|nr:cell division protein SepF [Selenomonadaceae bacterium]
MFIVDWAKKIADVFMPIETPEEEEVVTEKKQEEKPKLEQTQAQSLVEQTARRAASGGNVSTAHAVHYPSYTSTSQNDRPNLKLIKAPEFVMKVYTPADYNHINEIADDILTHKAIVVNYEYVREDEQRRICDYIDGVCYAIDGAVTKIAERIYLYVPAGISTSDIAALVASVRYR